MAGDVGQVASSASLSARQFPTFLSEFNPLNEHVELEGPPRSSRRNRFTSFLRRLHVACAIKDGTERQTNEKPGFIRHGLA